MSRSHHNGHGRCNVCGDKGAARRARESAADDTTEQLADFDDQYGRDMEQSTLFECDDCNRMFPCCGDDYAWLAHPAANANQPLTATLDERLVS